MTDAETGLFSLYWRLGRNSSGLRILHAGRASRADLAPRRLIAAGSADALDISTLRDLRDWVFHDGGTLWLTRAGSLAHDPWALPHSDASVVDLIAAAASAGEHQLGAGRVVVGPHWSGYEAFLSGPYPVDGETGAPVIRDVECRFFPSRDRKPGYFYLLNRSSRKRTVRIQDARGGEWALPSGAREIWKQAPDATPLPTPGGWELAPYDVLLFELPPTAADGSQPAGDS